MVEVEGDVVVPVDLASDKSETAARTLRPKIEKLRDRFLVKPTTHKVHNSSLKLKEAGEDLGDIESLERRLQLDRTVGPVDEFHGGGTEARRLLREFVRGNLDGYKEHRGKPGTDYVSHMSKYLHFGQISPVEVALAAREVDAGKSDIATFLEELIVRRELSMNHANFHEDYDRYEGLPDWAKQTLHDHRRDERPTRLRPRGIGSGRDSRPLLERRDGRDARDRIHAQSHANVLGKKDFGMVGDPRSGL